MPFEIEKYHDNPLDEKYFHEVEEVDNDLYVIEEREESEYVQTVIGENIRL